MASNEVRIIGGKWKGRKLRFPAAEGLRPTLGRVRETLFNWLVARLPGSQCLDLFAGSGALGFEALSRGAAGVDMVERNRLAARALRANAAMLDAGPACRIANSTAQAWLHQTRTQWDIIFLDPPFATGQLDIALAEVLATASLAPDGVVYFELPRREPASFPGYAILRESTAGDTRFGLLIAANNTAADAPPR